MQISPPPLYHESSLSHELLMDVLL